MSDDRGNDDGKSPARLGHLTGPLRVLGIGAAVAVAAMVMYPPWVQLTSGRQHRLGHGWLWDPPGPLPRFTHIAWGELGAQLIAALACVVVVALVVGPACRLTRACWALARRCSALARKVDIPRWFPMTMTLLVLGFVSSAIVSVDAYIRANYQADELIAAEREISAKQGDRSRLPFLRNDNESAIWAELGKGLGEVHQLQRAKDDLIESRAIGSVSAIFALCCFVCGAVLTDARNRRIKVACPVPTERLASVMAESAAPISTTAVDEAPPLARNREEGLLESAAFWLATLFGTGMMPPTYGGNAVIGAKVGQFLFLALVASIAWRLSRKSPIVVVVAVAAAVALNWIK